MKQKFIFFTYKLYLSHQYHKDFGFNPFYCHSIVQIFSDGTLYTHINSSQILCILGNVIYVLTNYANICQFLVVVPPQLKVICGIV